MPSFEYQVVRSKKFTSSLSLRIHPEKGIVVRAPYWVPAIAIRRFVEQKSEWIQKHLSKISVMPKVAKKYLEGEKHLYFGKEYPLVILNQKSPVRTEAKVTDQNIEITLFEGHDESKKIEETKAALIRFYLEAGIEYITERVNYFSNLLGVVYSQIDIKKVSSIWGSCSPTNKLCFNRKLIMAPQEVVDYVIIHEVCHMVQRNHSSRFWALVAKHDPLFREHKRWLHRNHQLLSI